MRALIAGIVHESSTFVLDVGEPTGLGDFEVCVEDRIPAEFDGTNTIVGGYLAACRHHGVTAVPVLHARAEPGAAVHPDAYRDLAGRLLGLVADRRPVEVVLLDLHGAGTLVGGRSLDLALVHRVRALVGPQAALAVTLDLHANVPAELVDLVDVMVGFQEYPHTDMATRAELAAALAVGQARGQRHPVVRRHRLPMLLPPSTTLAGAPAELRDLARRQEESAGVLACTVFHGFPYVDNDHATTSVVTVTDGDPTLADQVNERIGTWLWNSRDRFRIPVSAPADTVAAALAGTDRPVVIGDGTDNPGCGAFGDSTYLLRALLDSRARACLATLYDPAAVRQAVAAGVGARAEFSLGGRHGWASGQPVRATGTVRTITDGRVVQQSMRRGKTLEFGTSVRLDLGTVDVVLSSQRRQVLDPEILLLHGIEPDRYDIVAVKSVNHFRAGFASVGARMLVADAPGPLTRDIAALPRTGPTAALWPMCADASPEPAGGARRWN